jgi:DNA-binding beta-propeller fold protein YncE
LRLRPITLALIALFVAAGSLPRPAQAQGVGYFGKNKITYDEFDWKIYHSPHFDVYYYEAEIDLLPKIVSLAESAYDRISRRLDYQIDEATPLIFYATHSAFEQNNILVNFIPEGTGAFASPVRFRMVLPVDLPDAEVFQLIMHELTHIFEYHILFGGSLGRAVAQRPPTWMMEGFASYMAEDEQSWEKMFLRDAVVNDRIPPISRVDFGGYLAYRFGHAFFDFVEERWGADGVQDFIYELRNTIGARADRAVERAFRIEPEEFDADFRRWLRQRYLPELVATGEPLDFGRPFRIEGRPNTDESSAVASPSGDLIAAFSTVEGEVDVVLFDTRKRRFVRNLTPGFDNAYQYLVSQALVVPRSMGSDLAFSPDGDTVAVFGKRGGGRSLFLLDVLSRKVDRRIDMEDLDLEQQLAPTFSPDGQKIAFAAWRDGDFDVYTYDLETDELANVTDDDVYDGGPEYSPDGRRMIVSTVVEGYQKLFEIDLETGARRQLTVGDSHERDAAFSPDGKTLYFTSDRTGAENVYSVELATGRVVQHTNAVTGCFMPTVFIDQDGKEQLVYTGFWRGKLGLYLADPEDAIADEEFPPAVAGETSPMAEGGATEEGAMEAAAPKSFVILGGPTAEPGALPRFEPDIEVSIDMANREEYRGLKLSLENAETFVAVDTDQAVLGQAILSFSDYIGDRRLVAAFTSVYSFSNFDVIYQDTSRRSSWVLRLYDDRDYFFGGRNREGDLIRDAVYAETGLMGYLVHPFDFYRRVELGVGARYRDVPGDLFVRRRSTGELFQVYDARSDAYPVAEVAFAGDTARFARYGPVAGSRWRVAVDYAPDLQESGTLSSDLIIDARKYFPLTRRSNLALRAWGGFSEGNFTRPFFFGGLDQLRGLKIYSEVGDHAFYTNAELRFPLIDVISTPVFDIRDVRGVIFLDVGGAYFQDGEDFEFWDSDQNRLQDGISAYGFGVSAVLLGLPVNWEFSKQWDLKDTISDGFQTSFWIGSRF